MLQPAVRRFAGCVAVAPARVAPRQAVRSAFSQSSGARDTNYLKKEDTNQLDWLKLKHDIYQAEGAVDKIRRAPPKKVAFMPPVSPDEQVVPVIPVIYPTLDIKPPDAGLGAWKIPLVPAPKAVDVAEDGTATAIGRRKRAKARVWLQPGPGEFTVNGRPFNHYFPVWLQRDSAILPLVLTERLNQFTVKASTHGGGLSGQAGAIRLAIARALIKIDPELYPSLKVGRMLTRIPAEVESKKAGRKKARKKFTWVKR